MYKMYSFFPLLSHFMASNKTRTNGTPKQKHSYLLLPWITLHSTPTHISTSLIILARPAKFHKITAFYTTLSTSHTVGRRYTSSVMVTHINLHNVHICCVVKLVDFRFVCCIWRLEWVKFGNLVT